MLHSKNDTAVKSPSLLPLRRAVFKFGRMTRDSFGRIDHWLLTNGNKSPAGSIDVLNQQYDSGNQ
jgi:hypothetical protein